MRGKDTEKRGKKNSFDPHKGCWLGEYQKEKPDPKSSCVHVPKKKKKGAERERGDEATFRQIRNS